MVGGTCLTCIGTFYLPYYVHTAMRGYWARDDPAFLLILLAIMAGKYLKISLIFSLYYRPPI